MGFVRNAYLMWKSFRLPWRSDVLKGLDLDGNLYFERHVRGASRTRRHVVYKKYLTVSEYSDDIIPVQWQAWMRHTREQPPTAQELIQDIQRRERLAENVRRLAALEQEQKNEQAQAIEEGHRPQKHSPDRFQKNTPGEQYQPEEWAPSSSPPSATRASAAGQHRKH
ncbi:hypothetical protein GGF40_002246 [Coemansia sp. RSA 1286]|nr:hypothetical protein GGF40_002246 [Coemansia sp. RSA 1286]